MTGCDLYSYDCDDIGATVGIVIAVISAHFIIHMFSLSHYLVRPLFVSVQLLRIPTVVGRSHSLSYRYFILKNSAKVWFRRETRKLVTSRFSFILPSCRRDNEWIKITTWQAFLSPVWTRHKYASVISQAELYNYLSGLWWFGVGRQYSLSLSLQVKFLCQDGWSSSQWCWLR